MTYYKIQIISIIGSLLFLGYIAYLIVKDKLREEYAIAWILLNIVLITFAIWRDGLERISVFLGIYYPPSFLFLCGFGTVIIFLIHLSIVNSKQHRQIKDISHEIALLKSKMEKNEKKQKI